jgi:hypothetical protein
MPKKSTRKLDDDLRAEYKRSDFGVMERGKFVYLARLALEDKQNSSTEAVKSRESPLEEPVAARRVRSHRTS